MGSDTDFSSRSGERYAHCGRKTGVWSAERDGGAGAIASSADLDGAQSHFREPLAVGPSIRSTYCETDGRLGAFYFGNFGGFRLAGRLFSAPLESANETGGAA